jgi:hypothetical protein
MRRFSFLAVLFLWILACVEPYDAKLDLRKPVLFVDANLTDQPQLNYVKLQKSYSAMSGATISTFFNVSDADVWIEIDGSERKEVTLLGKGTYLFPEGFKAEEGRIYRLFIKLADGRQYESEVESIKKPVPVKNIYQRYVSNSIDIRNRKVSGHKIFIDFDDPEGKGDFYYWSWKVFEKQEYCISCAGGRYERSGPDDLGRCTEGRTGIILDYMCDLPCWEIMPSTKVVIHSDTYTDGVPVIAKEIIEIPHYTNYGAVVELRQHTISKEAYNYLKLIIDQNQNSGGFADTPSIALIGNMKSSDNKTESISGYFLVSSVNVRNYFMTRSDMKNPDPGLPIGFDPRPPNPEVNDPVVPGRPPLAPCIESDTRTGVKPESWTDLVLNNR